MCFEVNDIANVITRNAQRRIIFIVINPVFLTAEFSAQVNGLICYFVGMNIRNSFIHPPSSIDCEGYAIGACSFISLMISINRAWNPDERSIKELLKNAGV